MSERQKTLKRQDAIKELLKSKQVSDQKSLVELLSRQFGMDTNQTVISRDLRKLGVIKKQVNGVFSYQLPTIDIDQELLKLAVVHIQHNEVMVVIHTRPGLAAYVGDYLDNCQELDVMGCLAGENVVFVSPTSVSDIKNLYRAICSAVYFILKDSKNV